MSSFAINGRIVFDPEEGPTACAHAVPSDQGEREPETRRRGVGNDGDPWLHVLDLVAALAIELHRRGDQVTRVDVE